MSVWNEKPNWVSAPSFDEAYGRDEMDAWLEKLQRRHLEDKQILIDRIRELEPKAEKWDSYWGKDLETLVILKRHYEALKDAASRLEAAKAFLKTKWPCQIDCMICGQFMNKEGCLWFGLRAALGEEAS